jgi:hypothetical protein
MKVVILAKVLVLMNVLAVEKDGSYQNNTNVLRIVHKELLRMQTKMYVNIVCQHVKHAHTLMSVKPVIKDTSTILPDNFV